MPKKKQLNPSMYIFSDLHCPYCNSLAVVKTEQKEGNCDKKCNPQICQVTNCERSVHYVSSQQYSQRFLCLNCKKVFSRIGTIA
jgi:hypothetical protein